MFKSNNKYAKNRKCILKQIINMLICRGEYINMLIQIGVY